MSTIGSYDALRSQLAAERMALVRHPLYAQLATLDDVRLFTEHHVFAVWDFMSLLKCLQRALTCVDVPWVPRGDTGARRLVNEIVTAEESDDGIGGGFTSHFELYRAAMQECGADVARVDAFVALVSRGTSVSAALQLARAPAAARAFVESTFVTIESRSIARVAGAFTIGREDVIPEMFRRVMAELSQQSGGGLTLLVHYLDRHVRLDGDQHGPMAARLLESLCGADEARWRDAQLGAREALAARGAFWDAIAARITAPVEA
ncbi:MAG: DUF3050 domain-containing protein [Planctomycetota bacterium]